MPRIRISLIPLIPLMAGSLIAFRAAAFDTTCPETIVTDQQLSAPQDGWQPFARDPWGTAGTPPVHTRSGFSHIELYDGPPVDLADLAPDNEGNTWTLGKDNPQKRPLFMACVYDGTAVRLVRQLPPLVTRCVARKGGDLHCDEAGSH